MMIPWVTFPPKAPIRSKPKAMSMPMFLVVSAYWKMKAKAKSQISENRNVGELTKRMAVQLIALEPIAKHMTER